MKINNETKIGLMVTIVIALLVALTVKTGNFALSRKGYPIKVHFKNVDGVNLNSPVMFNGFEVGIVDDIVIKDDALETKIELTLSIREKAKLREGAKAYIKNLGFMGEKYVGLTSGDKGGSYLAPGDVIVGQEPPDFERLLAQGQDIATRINSITENIDERLKVNKDAVDGTLLNLDVTMEELALLVRNLNTRLSENEQKIDSTVSNLHGLSVNLEELSYDLKMNPWKILHKGKEKKSTIE